MNWFDYNGYWEEQADGEIDLTQLLQTPFLECVFEVRAADERLNVFKQSRGGAIRTRRKFLGNLEPKLSSANHMAELVREIRPYFLRNEPMGENPMLLQLANATLDLETNRIRKRFPRGYLAKMSKVIVPDYAMEGRDSGDPIIASAHVEWAYSLLWSIFRPCPSGGGPLTASRRR